MIIDEVQRLEDSGEVKEVVKKHALKCIDDVVRNLFSWDTETKKAIEQAVSSGLKLNLENVKLQQYNKVVESAIADRLNNTSLEAVTDMIKEQIDGITNALEKKEWKLSEIMSKFIDCIDTGNMEHERETCSLFIDRRGDWYSIRFDETEKVYSYECANTMYLSEERLVSVQLDEFPLSPFLARPKDSFEAFMFKLYCNNVKVIIDENNIELDYFREGSY